VRAAKYLVSTEGMRWSREKRQGHMAALHTRDYPVRPLPSPFTPSPLSRTNGVCQWLFPGKVRREWVSINDYLSVSEA